MTHPNEIDAFLSGLMPRLGAVAREGFANPGPVRYKTPGQPVTETDRRIEQIATDAILAAFPDHQILGEEGGHTEGSAETTWFIDPIDGTLNFSKGIPMFAISIGVGQKGRIVAGQVMDPLRSEHFRAVRGGGAFLNNEPITVSEADSLDTATVSMQTNASGRFLQKRGFMLDLHRSSSKTRKLGTIALELAYVSAGRMDLLVAGKGRPQAWWDISAGWLLVEEAGGTVTDLDGNSLKMESSHFVAGRETLVHEFIALFEEPAS